MKKIGLVGCGSVADFGHMPAMLRTPGLEIAGYFDPNPERVEMFQTKFLDRPGFTDPEEFWKLDMDAVTIASPAPVHKQNVLEAARRGLHVLCEKPIAMSDEDGADMQAAMDAAGLLFGVGYCYRFSPAARQIRQLVQDGAIGTVRSLRLLYVWNLHGIYEKDAAGNQVYSPARKARMLEGGPMVDCGVHMIDLARWWLGSEIAGVCGHGAWVEDYEAPDHVNLQLDHENGAHTMVEIAFTYTHTAKNPINYFMYHLMGTDGVILYDRGAERFEVRNSKGTSFPGWTSEKNFDGMYVDWIRALETGDLGEFPSAQDGIIATKIATDGTEQAIVRRAALGLR